MKDDVSAPNLGQANKDYDPQYFWQSYRSIEQWMAQLASKGNVKVATLTADTATIDSDATIGGDLTITGSVSFGSLGDLVATSLTTTGDVVVGDDLTVTDDVTISGTLTAADLAGPTTITGPEITTITTPGILQLGLTTGANIVIDSDDIQARTNGVDSKLYLNFLGGEVRIGSSAVATGGLGIRSTASNDLLRMYSYSTSTTFSGPDINLYRQKTGAVNDFLGAIRYYGQDTAGATVEMAYTLAKTVTPTPGAEVGQMRFGVKGASGLVQPLILNPTSVTPSITATTDLGSSSLRWATVYTSDLSLKNDVGDWTIVEGEDDLFIYNNKKGKKYKFALIEVKDGD